VQRTVIVGFNCTTSETEAGSKFRRDRPRLRGLQPGETASVFQGNHVQRLHRVPELFGMFHIQEQENAICKQCIYGPVLNSIV